MKEYSFEKLDVWQGSRKLLFKIYELTKRFPEEERFGLVSQMRRASILVGSNLAEGSARKTNKDRVCFISIAYGSLMELLNQVVLSNDLGFIVESDYLDIRSMIECLSRQMSAYRRSFEE